MKQYHSRSLLFLSELVIGVLIFAVVATICAVFFVQAHLISQKTAVRNQVVVATQNVAEAFHYQWPDEFLVMLNPYYDQQDNQFYLYFNQDFEPCQQKQAVYTLTALVQKAGSTRTVEITTTEKGDILYSLDITVFCPWEVS